MTDQTSLSKETESIAAMSALVSMIVDSLVDYPSAVSIQTVTKGNRIRLQVRVAPEDVGKLVGKQGRMARCLRTIISAASMNLQQRFLLDIFDEVS